MERDDIYARWANGLRERYGGTIAEELARLAEAPPVAVPRAAPAPAELEARRAEVASLRPRLPPPRSAFESASSRR